MPTKFDFVSPGVELREIDQSQITPVPEEDGLLLIGRAQKGPSMKPIKINSLTNFTDIFGEPIDGVKKKDPWREGNTGAPSYAGYAAQAYLASGVGPVKFIRLAGIDGKGTGDSDKAGWEIKRTDFSSGITRSNFGNTLGLFVAPSASSTTPVTGTLAAIFYSNTVSLGLTGSLLSGDELTAPAATAMVLGQGASNTFKMVLNDGAEDKIITFDFDKNSSNFIRNKFNTDPTKYDSSSATYFLGETFENQVKNLSLAGTGMVAFIAGLGSNSTHFTSFRNELTASKTGWFIGEKTEQKKLFRLIALDDGEQFQKEYYIVVKDLKRASNSKPDATFTVEIHKYGKAGYVEKYSNLTLNQDSPNFISKKIGDFHQEWEEGSGTSPGKFKLSGMFNNISDLVRVEVSTVASGLDLPVGFVGPKVPEAFSFSGSSTDNIIGWVSGKDYVPSGSSDYFVSGAYSGYTASIEYPTHNLTTTSSYLQNRNYPYDSVFGLRYKELNGIDKTIGDVGVLKNAFEMHLTEGEDVINASYVFTLEDIRAESSLSSSFYFQQGSFDEKTSIAADVDLDEVIINLNIKQFAAPFFGGFNGDDILIDNPYNELKLSSNGGSARNTVQQALAMVADRDLIRYDLISMPGIVQSILNQDLISQTESRGDALAIIDVEGIYQSDVDTGNTESIQSLNTIVSKVNELGLDSSYAATYYPNVRLRDTLSGNGTVLIAPPSVAAIGAIAKSEADSQPWFAPAGFNRGGLNPLGGSKGPAVIGSVEHLTKLDRDKLYEVNINPIARFPSTGDTVVFGQKTLQQSASALDRINVRRLMNYLKKEIGDIADTILFDQNIQATWLRFKTRADAVLAEVQTQFGVTEYKLVLDETTTTPDLQDRNVMYAKVFVKPARSIEFIAVDFVITQSGVEF
jgi:hypothetical protein